LQLVHGKRLDVSIVPPLMELMNLDGILPDEFLLKRPIQKCVDGLERFIIAGRGGVGDCGKKCQHIAFEQGIV
jgi:hypothetical protein